MDKIKSIVVIVIAMGCGLGSKVMMTKALKGENVRQSQVQEAEVDVQVKAVTPSE